MPAMSEGVTSDKSPRSPINPLADAIEQVRKLHGSIGRATVKPETAAIALGYKGLNGAALTALGTLSQYGLIERSKGTVAITPLSLRILHPTGDAQRKKSLREAALSPKIFRELFENYLDCTADVLSSHLVQSGFNVDRAKRAASVFVANKAFADLSADGTLEGTETLEERITDTKNGDKAQHDVFERGKTRGGTMLADYTVPLGGNEATIKIVGENLSTADFDELIEFINFCKKQFGRRGNAGSAHFEEIPPTREVADDFHTQHGAPYKPEGDRSTKKRG
jgi:hypothetical protein